ncbi:MAG: porin family protein [Bacteroidia bacterium]
MMKIGFVLAMALVWAQSFRIGIVGQPQSTWLLNKDDSDAGPELDYKSTVGMLVGASLAYNFTDYLGVGLDILYGREGQKYQGKPNGTTLTAQTKLGYLKFPLLFRAGSDPDAPVQFSFFVGPQLSLLLSNEDVLTLRDDSLGLTLNVTIKGKTASALLFSEELTEKPYKSVTFGVVTGIGAAFKLTDELSLSANFRVDYTFGDIENKNAKTSDGEPFWSIYKPKYVEDAPSANYTRPATHALTGGLLIGLHYTIPLR